MSNDKQMMEIMKKLSKSNQEILVMLAKGMKIAQNETEKNCTHA